MNTRSLFALSVSAFILIFAPGNLFADRLDEMISPVTNPVNFDDPRANTEARLIFMHQEIDDEFVTGGGNFQLYALELRYAVNDRLALLATKDGWINFNPDGVLDDESGFANIAVGAKYAFYKDDMQGRILTGGLRYEIPTGNRDVLQGEGDGFVQPFLTGAVALGDYWNFMTASGLRIAVDDEDSSFWDYDAHIDVKIGKFYPSLELNMVHVIEAGDRLPIADEGMDLISIGSSESRGKTLVTGAVGGRYRINDSVDYGIAYQIPLTNGAGSRFIDWRITTDFIFSF